MTYTSLTCIVILLLFSSISFSFASVNSTTPQSTTIICVGDSLTAGFGVDFDKSYPALLQHKLASKGYNTSVINSGVSGETSSGTLSRIAWVLEMKPDIVILETGANDGLRGIPTEIPEKNLLEIIHLLQEQDVVVVLAGMQMVWNLGEDYTRKFNAIYPTLAEKTGVIFMPFFLKDVATIQSLNQLDGLHPTHQGYEIITTNILPYVEKAIEQSNKEP